MSLDRTNRDKNSILLDDGIPCIIVPKDMFAFPDEIIIKSPICEEKLNSFTKIQNSKDIRGLKDAMRELRKKWKEKQEW